MQYGLTVSGFKRKRYADIIESLEILAKDEFGPNVNLSPASPLGVFIKLVAWSLSILWSAAENVYNAGYVDTAEGESLNAVAKYIGIIRRDASFAVGTVTITGANNIFIPAGFLSMSTENDVIYKTTAAVNVQDGSVDAPVKATVEGYVGNTPAGTVTMIVTPIEGVDSVTNTAEIAGGMDIETDSELRSRYNDSIAMAGASTAESIRASILAVDGVRDAFITVNDTMEEEDGVPPKAIAPLVYGGDAEDIAAAIYETKAAGIQCWGVDEEITIGTTIIAFNRPTFPLIEVDVTLIVNSDFSGEGDVQSEIIAYIGGVDVDETNHLGLAIGESVIYTRLIAAIHNVPGIIDVGLFINRLGDLPGTSNITIHTDEKAVTDVASVVVFVP